MIYAKTLNDLEVARRLKLQAIAATTPAGGGDISPAPAGPATSREDRSTAGATGVVEQRTADDLPPSVGSDEIIDFDLIPLADDDDTDPHAFQRSRRLVCSASTDGQVTIARKGEMGLALTAEEARTLYEFLGDAARIWGRAA